MNQPMDDFDPVPGVAEELSPGLRRILAPNPSPMTFRGTNTYLVGTTELAVIDPGPASEPHLQAIMKALAPGQRVTHVFVTHSHLDHSPLARALSDETGAPVLAFGDSLAGRSTVMEQLAATGMVAGGEGVDHDFTPDRGLKDGETVNGSGWTLEVIHTPGHLGNHIALGWGDICFTGDHVMGWASSLVSPPEGDLTDFMASCRRLRAREWKTFHAGHGAPITDPAQRLDWLISHRLSRETAILETLAGRRLTARTLAEIIYTETPAALMGAAERNVFAHLVDLSGRGAVTSVGPLGASAEFHIP